MTQEEFTLGLYRVGLSLQDLEGFCRVCYQETGKKSKNPLPTVRAILHYLGMDVPVHFNHYPLRPGLNVRTEDMGAYVNVTVDFEEV